MTVKGPMGLDGPGRMLAELEGATDLPWHLEEVDQGEVLTGGVAEILLTAVLAKSAEMSVEYAVGAVKRLAERWRDERLDPPDTEIRTEAVPDTDAPDTDDAPDAGGSPANGSDD
ncbi:hypothetical protein SY2F82_09310 [Streptomyces sp. Y2F8-2]|nr:hypothetical protein SY2F82_09310 [Streptomyces sp. Y2F8-2]